MLTSVPIPIDAGGLTFHQDVPGQYQWSVLSVLAHASRAAGGTGTRTFTLTVDNDTTVLLNLAATDTSPDPGVLTVCWASILPGATALSADGALAIPLPTLIIPAGYSLIGTLGNHVAGDVLTDAVVWVDQEWST